MSHRYLSPLASCLAIALLTTGCVSEKTMRTYVDQEVQTVHTRVDEVETQVEQTQTRLESQDKDLAEASATAREALERAVAAGKLAEGRFLFETVLSDGDVRFAFDKADLGDDAAQALSTFASRLKEANENVYIEIQGHTDATGAEDYNLDLGERRAENVRRFLNREHGLALHRMATISYGESAPIADNAAREGRELNRRVVLVVLK